MGAVVINRMVNANVYVDGGSQFGKAESIDLPEVKAKMGDHNALGMIGDIEFPNGLDKMTLKMKWNSIYADVIAGTSNFYVPSQLQFRGNVEIWDASGGKTADVPCVVYVGGTWTKSPNISQKSKEAVDSESEMSVKSYVLEYGGIEVLAVDVVAQIYRVNGVDVYQQYRQNLGI